MSKPLLRRLAQSPMTMLEIKQWAMKQEPRIGSDTATHLVAWLDLEGLIVDDKGSPAKWRATVMASEEPAAHQHLETNWSLVEQIQGGIMGTEQLAVIETGDLAAVLVELKRQRLQAETSAALFLTSLYVLESKREDLWRHSGLESVDGPKSFDMFLNSHSLCNSARYREFCAGLAKLGGDPQVAVKLGEGAVSAARFFKEPTKEKVEQLAERVENFELVNKVKPSEQHAESWVKQIDPREPKVTQRVSELARLQAENQDLRAKLKAAERAIREKDAELAKLRSKLTAA